MIAPRVRWSSPEGRRRTRELPPSFVDALDLGGRVDNFWLNVRPDPIDFRDKPYQPGLIEIAPYLELQHSGPAHPRPGSGGLVHGPGARRSDRHPEYPAAAIPRRPARSS